jgi:hypothetical protein
MMRTHVSRRSSAVAAQDQRDEHGRSKTGQGTPHTHLQPGNGLSEPRAHPAAGHFAPSSFHEPDLITEPVCSVPATNCKTRLRCTRGRVRRRRAATQSAFFCWRFLRPPLPHRRQRRVTCATDGHRNNRGSIRYCDLSGPFDLSADFQKRKLLCLLTFARGVDDPHH